MMKNNLSRVPDQKNDNIEYANISNNMNNDNIGFIILSNDIDLSDKYIKKSNLKLSDNQNENKDSISEYLSNNISKYNIKNKNGKIIKSLNEIFSDDDISENINNYKELNDDIDNNFSDIIDIESNKIIFNSSNKLKNDETLSYNINSPIDNSKIYKIDI
jgi:hypothetical protein